ncbi:DUF4402 domain-containing protein [Cetobacterium sp. 2A]|uniref:DUF4402 domain-containing protein n=1 Tax=Cetobacterium sp. 2A TaxID=2754723 RepID=UPI00163C8C5B|nr:DUF4402 domain-containing protein [Cetobacterium sp. 2A]MBC2855550.1 DUF4402 domain-containing protein [Cetobacterium sp. 2A]
MKKIFLVFITVINILFSKDFISAPKMYKPAEMNIEVTKIKTKSTDMYIDKVNKKIYKEFEDIKERTTKKNLYITTSLERKNKKIVSELEYEILEYNGKKILVIDYENEPSEIYLWIIENESIKNIYKGNLMDRAEGISPFAWISRTINMRVLNSDVTNQEISIHADRSINYNSGYFQVVSGMLNGMFFVPGIKKVSEIVNGEKKELSLSGQKYTTSNRFEFSIDISGSWGESVRTLKIKSSEGLESGVSISIEYSHGRLEIYEDIINFLPSKFEILSISDMDFGTLQKGTVNNSPITKANIKVKSTIGTVLSFKVVDTSIELGRDGMEESSKITVNSFTVEGESAPTNNIYEYEISGIANVPSNALDGNYSGVLYTELTLSDIKGGKF